jgi:hypothetical protein
VELDADYDFNMPPPTPAGQPLQVLFSVNLRNIIQVGEPIGTKIRLKTSL